ncbi:MAG: TadE/TadG family type IV pilus assembly protein [Bdellovibrionia bacterium]
MGFTIMAADKTLQNKETILDDDSGQSVLEFLLVLPVLMTIVMLIIRVNTAIQMSIVDQKYARAQTLFITGNAAEYPLRAAVVSDLAQSGMNQLVVGVSEDPPRDPNGGEGDQKVSASTYYIGRRPGGMSENSDSGDDISKRVTIRVRNTVTLCLPMINLDGKPAFDFNVGGGGSPKYNYKEDPRSWQFCSSKLEQRG